MFIRYFILGAAVTAFVAPLSGCGEGFGDACDNVAVSSALVQVLDEFGDPVVGADVRYQPADGMDQSCEELGAEPGQYVCGYEVPGSMTITVDALGFEVAQIEVDVQSDECHVITEEVELMLTPE